MNSIDWEVHYGHLFLASFRALRCELEILKQKNPDKLMGHPKVKLYRCLVKVLQEIKNDPKQPQYHLGNTLGVEHRDWKRAKNGLPSRYRLFFKYFSSPEYDIFIAWLNDEKTLRKEGAKSDCYKVFQQLLEGQKIPSNQDDLIAYFKTYQE